MVFEPTFEELGKRSAELAAGGDPDANLPVTDDVPDAQSATDDSDADDLAAAGAEGSLAAGDVPADDLPPYGN